MLKFLVGFLLMELMLFLGKEFGFLPKRTEEEINKLIADAKMHFKLHPEIVICAGIIVAVLMVSVDYFIGSLFLAPFGF